MEDENEIKMILLGNCGVGKTSIISRYIKDEFNADEMTSTGANYATKRININSKEYILNLWDTAGQERYNSVTKMFIQNAQIVLLCYSITDKKSFKNLNYWLKMANDIIGENNYALGIAGNKADLFLEEEVKESEGIQFAKEHNGLFKLVSAKESREGIDDYFVELFTKYLDLKNGNINIYNDNYKEEDNRESLKITNVDNSVKKSKKCCISQN